MKCKLPPLNALKAFEAAGRFQSFSKAAEHLCVTQSAISKQVRQLEDHIGQSLFIRKHRQLILTRFGETLLHSLQHAFAGIGETLVQLTDQEHIPELRIQVPPTFAKRWLLPRMHSLRQAFPDTELHINIISLNRQIDQLHNEIFILFGQANDWPKLHCQRIYQEQHIVVCSPQCLDFKDQQQLDVTRLPLIETHECGPTWQDWLNQQGQQKHNSAQLVTLDLPAAPPKLFFDTLDLAIHAALAGLGAAIIDQNMITQELASGALLQCHPQQMPGNNGYYLASESANTPVYLAFKHWLESRI